MKKHQTITGFVAVVLLAAVATATAATMRSQAPSSRATLAPAGFMSIKELAVDVNKLAVEEFDDLSLVYSTATKH
jgi:predicted transglutaminase-like cysteine proteinase